MSPLLVRLLRTPSTFAIHADSVPCTGVVLALLGQVLRSTAMIHAATNFSHQVAFRKAESHQLVTNGIYA